MNNNTCEHCYPETSNHVRRKFFSIFDYYILSPFVCLLFKVILISQGDILRLDNLFNRFFTCLFYKLSFYKTTTTIDKSQLNNSELAFWDEAQKRGMELYNFIEGKAHTLNFMFVHQGKKYYYTQTPINILYQKYSCFDSDLKFDNKWTFKKKLLANKLPCPEGKAFTSNKRAYKYGIKLGFPLTVKPTSASLGVHVVCDVKTPEELKEAIRIVKQVDICIMIEKHILGDVYRALIINNALEACVMREPDSIVGDGIHTVEELIARKTRGKALVRQGLSKAIDKILTCQKVSLNTILEKRRKIFLSSKVTMSSGANITNVTDLINPENKQLLEKAHKILNIPMSGLDCICQDISLPWHQQEFVIIENNSFPYIDMHLNPSDGKCINVASKIWDFVLDGIK